MPSNMSEERKKMLRLYGAELIEVGPGDFDSAIKLVHVGFWPTIASSPYSTVQDG